MIEKIREVLRLQERGFSQSQIQAATGLSRTSVQKYVKLCRENEIDYQKSTVLSDSDLKARIGVLKPGAKKSHVKDPDFTWIRDELKARKGTTRELLWKEWVDSCPDGLHYSYNTFCSRYREWCKDQKVWMRQDYIGGEKALIDYAGETLSIEVGTPSAPQRVEIFVGVLGASNYIYCEASSSQDLEDWQASHVRMFEFFGGVPQCLVIDNLKSGVLKPDRYEPLINHIYQKLADHYHTAVLPTRVAKPQDKAKVETAVKLVEIHVLAPLRHRKFRSIAELNEAIAVLLEALNQRRMKDYDLRSRKELFEELDKPHLQPLPRDRFTPQRWQESKVAMDYHIQVDHNYYSVPFHLCRKFVQVKITEKLIEIFFENERVASHKRSKEKHSHCTKVQHMPAHHRFSKSHSKEKFLRWGKGVGPETYTLVEKLLYKGLHPEQGFRSVLGLQRLEKMHGTAKLEKAAGEANEHKQISQRYVRIALDKMRQEEEKQEAKAKNYMHENLRGSSYYH